MKAFLLLYPLAFDSSVAGIFWTFAEGGTLVLAEERFQEDLPGLLELLARYEVTHLDSLPSLHNVLLELAGPGQLASVRNVVVGGEACAPAVIRRHLEVLPHAGLYNEYGPTEATVTTTVQHCRSSRPDGPVSIGRPTGNAQTYVLDARQRALPPGAIGEILIGGGGVARGYHRQPRMTAINYLPDPFGQRPGARLYRTRDLARYRNDGRLDFLARIGHQVKVRGFRVELGEIEAALREHPDLREAAVVLREDRPGDRRLVAYTVPRREGTPTVRELRRFLEERLPAYSVPARFVELEALPLNVNGKVDRPALPPPQRVPEAQEGFDAPHTPAEILLAEVWSEVLRVEKPGALDNFFELGGDSILSIQIVGRANRKGLRITTRQLFEHPTIAELARISDEAPEIRAEQGAVVGELPLTAIQRWFFEEGFPDAHHFNQAVLFQSRQPIDPLRLERAVAVLLEHHDSLRLRFERQPGGWRQLVEPVGAAPVVRLDLSGLPTALRSPALEAGAAALQASLDPSGGTLLRVAFFDFGEATPSRLLIVIHHLAVDGVSWRILLEDLQSAYEQLARAPVPRLPEKTTSFKYWAERVTAYARSRALAGELDYWSTALPSEVPGLPLDDLGGEDTVATSRKLNVSLSADETSALLRETPRAYRTQINDVLLTALVRSLSAWTGSPLLVDLEGHGREELFEEVDLSRTVGWFTAVFPVLLDLTQAEDAPGTALKTVKEQLRAVTRHGIGYGLLRYLGEEATVAQLAALPRAEVLFNYLGQFDQRLDEDALFEPAPESSGRAQSARGKQGYLLSIEALITRGELRISWTYDETSHRRATIETLAEGFLEELRALIAHCSGPETMGYTPSDFPLARLTQAWLDRFADPRRPMVDVYPLSPMQEGMFFHTISDPQSAMYFEQVGWQIAGPLHLPAFRGTWIKLTQRHPILRTAFVWEGLPAPVQVVYREVELPWEELDWRTSEPAEQKRRLRELLVADRERGFEFSRAPLLRVTVIQLAQESWEIVLSHHHALMDGWSFPVLLDDLFTLYEALEEGRPFVREHPQPYREYIAWLARQDLAREEAFWRRTLEGVTAPTALCVDWVRQVELDPMEIFGERYFRLSSAVSAALKSWARRRRITLNTVVQGLWAQLLSRYSSTRDVIFGVTVSGRPAELPGVESIVGLFINTMPVRVRSRPEELLSEALPRLQLEQVEQREYEYTPLTQIRRWSDVPGGRPLFESILVFENYPLNESLPEVARAALEVHDVLSFQRANFPLTLVAVPGRQLAFRLSFDRRRFSATTVGRLLGHLENLLAGTASQEDPRFGDLPLLTSAERHQALAEWSTAARTSAPAQTIGALFAAHVEKTPEALAVVYEGAGLVETLSYRELDQRASRLARQLRALGVGPE